MGRYIIEYTFGNDVLRLRLCVAVKLNFRPYIQRYTSPNENFEYSYRLIYLYILAYNHRHNHLDHVVNMWHHFCMVFQSRVQCTNHSGSGKQGSNKINGVSEMLTRSSLGEKSFILFPLRKRCADPEEGTGDPHPPPLKNHKNIGFFSDTGPDSLKNLKGTKPAVNVWPSSARQQNAILLWRFAGGPMMARLVLFGSSFPHQIKNLSELDPLCKTVWIHACKM